MVQFTPNPSGWPHAVEAALTDVDLPASVNCGVGKNETQALANLQKQVAEYIRSLEQADYTVLREVGDTRRNMRKPPPASTMLISWEQYQITRWYETNTLSSHYLAERLGGVHWLCLDQELRGARVMSKRRLLTLRHLIKELDPTARFSAKPRA